jgi:hypothetical protein
VLSSFDELTSRPVHLAMSRSCHFVHLAMTEGRDDAETCSENCASPSRDLLKTCTPCGVHVFIVAVLGQLRRPCSPLGDHDHLCRRQLVQPRTPCDALDHLHCRTALTTSCTLRCPPSCSPPCSSRDVLTLRRSPSRSLLRSPHNVRVLRRSRSYVPLGGHVSCSSFDDHVMLAFTVPAFAFVFRRSRSHPRSGFNVVRSCEHPSSIPLRVHASLLLAKQTKRAHLLVLVSAFVFRRSRPDALRRLTVHGLARSCHVSTAQSSDPLSVRGPSPRAAPVHRVRARLATITFACPYGFLRAKHVLRHAPLDETQSRFRVVFANFGRRCPRTPRPKLSPLPRRPDRPASLDAHDPKALPCSRSRNVCSAEAKLNARVHFTPCGAIEHTHCARSYSAYCHRESLAFSSPKSPSCSSF